MLDDESTGPGRVRSVECAPGHITNSSVLKLTLDSAGGGFKFVSPKSMFETKYIVYFI